MSLLLPGFETEFSNISPNLFNSPNLFGIFDKDSITLKALLQYHLRNTL